MPISKLVRRARNALINPSHVAITLIVSAYLAIAFNGPFFEVVRETHSLAGTHGALVMLGLGLILWAVLCLLLTVVGLPYTLKPLFTLLILLSSLGAYAIVTYNIVIDKTMIENVVETDPKEAAELFSIRFLLFFAATGILPAIALWTRQVHFGRPLAILRDKALTVTLCFVVVAVTALPFYQDYVSLARNSRHAKDLIVPLNIVGSLSAYADDLLPENQPVFTHVGRDSRLGAAWQAAPTRRVVSVLVVGESARSDHFQLYGYARSTTPGLATTQVIPFTNVTSCGTTTAVSVRCMFSWLSRNQYDKNDAVNSDNLIDVLGNAGLPVTWWDNNSGCKDVCARIGEQRPDPARFPDQCDATSCYDTVLLQSLEDSINQTTGNVFVVLHQAGSHGPAYYLRVPAKYRYFTPVCQTNMLEKCSRKEIINAYDNSIRYTDALLTRIIGLLNSRADAIDANLIYVADHGESLGENNIYLHGLPYAVAPAAQTQIPMIYWSSDSFATRFGINQNCLRQIAANPLSHDNLFSSVLGLLNVETTAYQPAMDLFEPCYTNRTAGQARVPLHAKT